MRIGVNVRYLSSNHPTGVDVYIESLIRHLKTVAPEHEVILFLGGGSQTPERLRDVRTTHVRSRWPTGSAVTKLLWDQVGLGREIRAAALDVFHGPYFALPFATSGPTVVTVHDLAYAHCPESFTWRFSIYWHWLLPAALRRATRIIAPSENTKADLVSRLGVAPERVCVTYEGVDPFFHESITDEERHVRLQSMGIRRPYLLHVSGFARRKNVPVVLEAVRLLRNRGRRDHALVLAGGGGWSHRLGAEVAARGVEDATQYTGHVSREDLRALYVGAAALVYPSLYEGFGLPPLEAMACGTPVVAADTSSLPEVVGDAGVLVDPGDAGAWADALDRVLTDTTTRHMLVERGRRRARSFSWDRTARQTLAVYKEAAAEAG